MTRFTIKFLAFGFLCYLCSCTSDTTNNEKEPIVASQDSSKKKNDKLVISYDSSFQKTTYSIKDPDCNISFSVYHSDSPNKGVITNNSQCSLPLNLQKESYEQILLQIFEDEDSIKTVSWGILSDRSKIDYEMALRLAIASKNSSLWDSKKGTLKNNSESLNVFVKEIANKEIIYPEIKKLFEEVGYRLKVSHVEKVTVSRAGDMPYFDELKKRNIKASEKFPADALIDFSLEKIKSIE